MTLKVNKPKQDIYREKKTQAEEQSEEEHKKKVLKDRKWGVLTDD